MHLVFSHMGAPSNPQSYRLIRAVGDHRILSNTWFYVWGKGISIPSSAFPSYNLLTVGGDGAQRALIAQHGQNHKRQCRNRTDCRDHVAALRRPSRILNDSVQRRVLDNAASVTTTVETTGRLCRPIHHRHRPKQPWLVIIYINWKAKMP